MKEIPKRYKHQDEALAFSMGKPSVAFFMEQGTGKSKVAIDRASYLFSKDAIDCVVIVSPNAVKEQWITEQFPLHCDVDTWKGYLWEGAKTLREKDLFMYMIEYRSLAVFSFNVEAFQSDTVDTYIKLILQHRRPLVVIDESTKIKNGRRRGRGKRGGAKRTNKILDFFEFVKYKMILTGTPTPNNPFDLWSQYEFLHRDYFGLDYFMFTHHYGIMIQRMNYGAKKSYNKVIDNKEWNTIKNYLKQYKNLSPNIVEELAVRNGVTTKDILMINSMESYSGYKNLDELKRKISQITFFVKKKDCLDLPDKVYETLYAPLGAEQKRLYNSLKQQMYAEYGGEELTVTTKMIMALRLQMITGGLFPYSETDILVNGEGEEYFDTHFETKIIGECGKLQVLLDDLENVSEETSIIVWARFRKEIEMIEKALLEAGHTCEKYYGGSEGSIIARFKNKDFRILIGTTLKGGEGLNLQVATLHYFYSNSFKADARLQAEDRSHRIGQTNKVTYKDIICKGTIDQHIYNVLKRKENLINFFRTKGIYEFLEVAESND